MTGQRETTNYIWYHIIDKTERVIQLQTKLRNIN